MAWNEKRGTHLRSGPKYGDGKASGDVWKVGEDFKTDRQKDKNTAKTVLNYEYSLIHLLYYLYVYVVIHFCDSMWSCCVGADRCMLFIYALSFRDPFIKRGGLGSHKSV